MHSNCELICIVIQASSETLSLRNLLGHLVVSSNENLF